MKVVGIKRKQNEKLLLSGRHLVWFCDGCGEAFIWDENCAYYGSDKDIENQDYHRVWLACSPECCDKKPADFPKGVRRPKGKIVSRVNQ